MIILFIYRFLEYLVIHSFSLKNHTLSRGQKINNIIIKISQMISTISLLTFYYTLIFNHLTLTTLQSFSISCPPFLLPFLTCISYTTYHNFSSISLLRCKNMNVGWSKSIVSSNILKVEELKFYLNIHEIGYIVVRYICMNVLFSIWG